MTPPAGKHSLRRIDPHDFALHFASAVAEHIDSLQHHFFGPAWKTVTPKPESTEIYRVICELASYARGELTLKAPVREYLGELAPLYSSVLGTVISSEPEDEAPDTALGVVIHAALGREQLELGEPLTTPRLGALAGVSSVAIVKLIQKGELAGHHDECDGEWHVHAEDAQRWLDERAAN